MLGDAWQAASEPIGKPRVAPPPGLVSLPKQHSQLLFGSEADKRHSSKTAPRAATIVPSTGSPFKTVTTAQHADPLPESSADLGMKNDPFIAAVVSAALPSARPVEYTPPSVGFPHAKGPAGFDIGVRKGARQAPTRPQPAARRPPRILESVRARIEAEMNSDQVSQRLEERLSELAPKRRLEYAEAVGPKPVPAKSPPVVGAVGIWDGRKLASTAVEDPWGVWGDGGVSTGTTTAESEGGHAAEEEIESLATRIHSAGLREEGASSKSPTAVFQSSLTTQTPAWIYQEQSLPPGLFTA